MRQDFHIIPVLGSRTLVIALTSYGGHATPASRFEWVNVVTRLNVNAMFLRDTHQQWYHAACLGFSTSFDHTLLNIRSFIRANAIERVITLGSSMGGHGALLLGAHLNADHAVTFAPQVNMHSEWLQGHNDDRWSWKATELNSIGYADLDISALYRDRSAAETLVYFDGNNQLDRMHAELLGFAQGVKMFDVGAGSHELAYMLTKSGEVTRILQDRI